jgi:hypothetical protein
MQGTTIINIHCLRVFSCGLFICMFKRGLGRFLPHPTAPFYHPE